MIKRKKAVRKKREYAMDSPTDRVAFYRDRAKTILKEGGQYKLALDSLSLAAAKARQYQLPNRADIDREYRTLMFRQNPFDEEAMKRRTAYSSVSIVALVSGFILLSGNITGNVVGPGELTPSVFGAALVMLGVIAAGLYFKRRV